MSQAKRISNRRHKKTKARFRTVIYTLFGAYIIPRGGEVHVGNLIELVRPLGFSANAIRLGLSRMSRYGVFKIRRKGRRSYYSLSPKGMHRMEKGKVRAFDVKHKKWDGRWRLVVYKVPETLRTLRDKLRTELCNMGFASLSASVWISPHNLRSQIAGIVKEIGVTKNVEMFEAEYTGFRSAKEFAVHMWDIEALKNRYQVFVRKYTTLRSRFESLKKRGSLMGPGECFAERFCLTAEYVALRLDDPMLPLKLLPANWVGLRAQILHDAVWRLLKPAADDFADRILQK
jgi:phenylacetic acid degradation operon negative regulatory protein